MFQVTLPYLTTSGSAYFRMLCDDSLLQIQGDREEVVARALHKITGVHKQEK